MSQPSNVLEKTSVKANEAAQREKAKSPSHFEKGIKTCSDLASGMSLLMADVLSERVSTSIANSVCNQAGKMLKAVEMQQRYGKTSKDGSSKELKLIGT